MRLAQIGHMDVVADTGTVRGVVVGTEHGDVRPKAGGGLQHQRNQMGLRLVALAQLTVGIGAGGVEVAQAHRFQSVSHAVIRQHLLDHPLAASVGVDGILGMILVDGRSQWFAENRRRGRKDEMVDPVRDHRIQQILGFEYVVEIVLGRLAYRFADLDMGSEMQHAVEARGSEQLIQQVPFAQIPQYEASALDRVTVAGGQIVQHRHLEPPLTEQLDHVGTDITRSADHEHVHGDFSSVFDTYSVNQCGVPVPTTLRLGYMESLGSPIAAHSGQVHRQED